MTVMKSVNVNMDNRSDNVIHCNTLQHTATHCNTLQHTATLSPITRLEWRALMWTGIIVQMLQHTATHCNTPQHTATHCNTLQHTATLPPITWLLWRVLMWTWIIGSLTLPKIRLDYGVATISRLLKMIGLFCKRALQKRLYSAKETYNFIIDYYHLYVWHDSWSQTLLNIRLDHGVARSWGGYDS